MGQGPVHTNRVFFRGVFLNPVWPVVHKYRVKTVTKKVSSQKPSPEWKLVKTPFCCTHVTRRKRRVVKTITSRYSIPPVNPSAPTKDGTVASRYCVFHFLDPWYWLQLFRENAVGNSASYNHESIVGGSEFTVLQRDLKEWHERPWTHVCEC